MRHKLYLDDYTQKGKNRITLPSALANYYGNTAQAYVGDRQVESKYEKQGGLTGDGVDAYVSFSSPISCDRIIIKANFYGISSTQYFIGSSNYASAFGIRYNGSTLLFDGSGTGSDTIAWTAPNRAVELDFRMNDTEVYDWDLYIDGVYTGEFTNVGTINVLNLFKQTAGYYFGNTIYYLKTYNSGSVTFESNFVRGDSLTTLYDESGNGHHGTLNNFDTSTCWVEPSSSLTFTTPTPTREIEIARGNLELTDVEPDTENRSVAVFDASESDRITVPDYGIFGGGTQSFTISVWVKRNNVANEMTLFTTLHERDFNFSFGEGIGDASKLTIRRNNGSWGNPVSGGTTVANKWYLATVVYDSGWYLYLNSVLVDSNIGSENIATSTVSSYNSIGCYYLSSTPYDLLDGYMSDLRVYNRGLSSEEVNSLYEMENITNGLYARYKLSENGNDFIGDYDGTNNGITFTTVNDFPIPIKTPPVLHWTPSSESGYYWVLTEDKPNIFKNNNGTIEQFDKILVNENGTLKEYNIRSNKEGIIT